MTEWLPTENNLKKLLPEWDKPTFRVPDLIITQLFQQHFPKNTDANCNIAKVQVLNAFYSTNVQATWKMAKHIENLALNNNLDLLIEKGDLKAVNLIARLEVENDNNGIKNSWVRYFYSFASKYCSFHNPEAYPMFDSIVKSLLVIFLSKKNIQLRVRDFDKNYEKFYFAFKQFTKLYCIETMKTRDIDKALWLYGKQYLKIEPINNQQ